MLYENLIKSPTILLNANRAKENIARMAAKAAAQNVRFRPHFKTHQSAVIGEWFREAGVGCITVSSVKMAQYFAQNGWNDILIAFPVNLREIDAILELSTRIQLGLLVDHLDTLRNLAQTEALQADIWIKIDTGMGRAGIRWTDIGRVEGIATLLQGHRHLRLRGLLTHAGQTYHATSAEQIKSLYRESTDRLVLCRNQINSVIGHFVELSVGDTPGCWLSEDLGSIDEIRPGNFIFFDAMMFSLGVCREDEIALSVACPVVSKYDDRSEVLIYGGAVHLSKEVIENSNPAIYGFAVTSSDNSLRMIRESNFIRSLSQEHGIVKLDRETYEKIVAGDLLYIIPVHSCLVVEALRRYLSTDGDWIETGV